MKMFEKNMKMFEKNQKNYKVIVNLIKQIGQLKKKAHPWQKEY